jgi:hypothetical protein
LSPNLQALIVAAAIFAGVGAAFSAEQSTASAVGSTESGSGGGSKALDAGRPTAKRPEPEESETEETLAGKWSQRTVRKFPVRFFDHGLSSRGNRCDEATHTVRNILIQLGARPSDFHVDACHLNGNEPAATVDATFSVLLLADRNEDPIVPAHWQPHEWKGTLNCLDIGFLAHNVLPLFTTRNVQVLSPTDCRREGVAVRAEFLTETM